MLFFAELEAKLAVIHDAADRRIGCRRNLHQIQLGLFGHAQRFGCGNDAYLFPVGAYQADGRYVDGVVQPRFFTSSDTIILRNGRLMGANYRC
ncbi:hypothetical protein MoryE10_31080 [Methylogaea oryzae]|uniref:Uncharacterized protein n=1 Tax=Methylogaea oryzae TaxID=1295382 RepID=A0A8D4VRQ4_9GAMM|nr:hypothetical protein MoryE10_31080 [Methylogaea oryzae]